MQNKLKKVFFYVRLVIFIASLIVDFLLIKAINRIGLFGYIFLIIELFYIVSIIYTLLIKSKECQNSYVFNIMQVGMYFYKIIIYIQSVSLGLLFYDKDVIRIYQGNFILMSILLLLVIIYEVLLISPKKKSF